MKPSGRVLIQEDRFYWPEGLRALPVTEVEAYVLRHAGARPWDRDPVDERIPGHPLVGAHLVGRGWLPVDQRAALTLGAT